MIITRVLLWLVRPALWGVLQGQSPLPVQVHTLSSWGNPAPRIERLQFWVQRTLWSWLSHSMQSLIMTAHCHFSTTMATVLISPWLGQNTKKKKDITGLWLGRVCHNQWLKGNPLLSTANVSPDNKKILTSLHNFCKSGIKLSTFIKNISSISIYSSYHVISHLIVKKLSSACDPSNAGPAYPPAPFQPNTLCELRWRSIFSCVSTGATLVCSVSVSVISFVLFSTSSLGTWLLHF